MDRGILEAAREIIRSIKAAFLFYGGETMNGKWGEDIRNLMMAAVVGALILAAVNPQEWKDDTRKQNKAIKKQNRRVMRAVVKLQALYRGHKARGKYDVPVLAKGNR